MTRPADDGIPSVLTIKQTAAAVNLEVTTLRQWIKTEYVQAFQTTPGGTWYVPRPEVERIARVCQVTPDWLAALNT